MASAGWGLWAPEGPTFSVFGLAITIATIPIMYPLARRKLTIGEKIDSRALRAGAIDNLRLAVFRRRRARGAARARLVGRSVTSLAIIYFLVKEGREAWNAEACGCCSCD